MLIGVIGIAVAIYEGRNYRGPKLAYQYDGFSLIRSYDAVFPESIEVTFGGERVPNLTHSQIVIWNHGRGPLTKNDVSAQDPLFIGFGGDHKILQAEIVKRTSDPNAASITYTPRDSRARFDFEFLDSQDGVLVSVWHTSPRPTPSVRGTIINKNAGPFRLGRFVGPRPNVPDSKNETTLLNILLIVQKVLARRPVIASVIIMALGVIVTIIAVSMWLSRYFQIDAVAGFSSLVGKSDLKGSEWAIALPGLVYFITGFLLWKQVRRRFPKTLLPDEYQVVEE